MTKIYVGSDHAGFDFKEKLKIYLEDMGHEVIDKGAFSHDPEDDYPDFILPVARSVAAQRGSVGVIIGASGQGEAMCANRVKGARAAVFYGRPEKSQTDMSGQILDLISSARVHNNANILSLGMRFLSEDEAKEAIRLFLDTNFAGEERHLRRINKLDA